jgi:gamma-butyrobetaine dioxygenase
MSEGRTVKRVSSTPELLTVEWADGEIGEYAGVWLRDNRREDRDPHSGQRLIDIVDLPRHPEIRSAAAAGTAIRIEWEHESAPATYPLDWLAAHRAGGEGPFRESAASLWLEGASLSALRDFAWITLEDLQRDNRLKLRWLTQLLRTGIAFMSAVPATDGALLQAMSGIGRVCETNYGRVFDVRSVPAPENLAYSDLGLGLHTDNPYREPVPGFQALHILAASPDGGDSLFADGFAVSRHLRVIDPRAFDILTRTPVPFHYRARYAELYAERPLIQLSCRGEVAAVHYNSRSIAPIASSGRDAEGFYAAYRRFAELLRDRRYQMSHRLRSGDLVLFDNQRILHGRTAFSSMKHSRHLRGCYLTRDSVHSETALLRRESKLQEPT